jgi:beta-lactam-binding protein with PASTA domain
VPHLVGLHRPEAVRALEARGLFVQVKPEGSVDDDVVVGQRPEADVRIPRHSLVVLTVRCVPAPCPAPPEGTTIYDPCSCAFR